MIENKILTRKKFSELVENKVKLLGISYIDACVMTCEEQEYQPEDIQKVVSPSIIQKIENEAHHYNLIKGGNTTSKLPI